MKRFISKIIAIIGIMLCMIPLAACQKETAPGIRDMYVVMYDNVGNEYEMYETYSKCEYKAEYDYKPNFVYLFSCTTFYRDNDEKFMSRNLLKIRGDDVGEHIVSMWNLSREYILHVVIKEKSGLMPEVRFDPMGAVEYIENERYVYEYDGEEHYPHIKLSYNGKDLILRDKLSMAVHCPPEIDASRAFVDVGVYEFVYLIDDSDFIKEKDKGVYTVNTPQITVEIIPAE